VIDAASAQQDLVIVGHSYGAFIATLVAARLPARLLVLLAGMILAPEKAQANGGLTPATGTPSNSRPGSTAARPATTTAHQFLQRSTTPASRGSHAQGQARGVTDSLEHALAADAWPNVPSKFILCKDDLSSPQPLCGGWHNSAWAQSPTAYDTAPIVLESPPPLSSPSMASPTSPASWPINREL
jgi:pimeloyl-ACP methyl ester carboxylesterase